MRMLGTIMVAAVLVVGAGCGDEAPMAPAPITTPETSPESAVAGAGEAPANGGTITAQVRYSGPPEIDVVQVNKDVEQCGTETRVERIVVGPDQGLRDAVVSVASATGPARPSADPRPALDQRECEFRPRVLGMQAGEVDILNSDGILHNVRTSSTANPPINKAQPRFKTVMTERFDEPEMIRVRCDVHTWMEGWLAVMPSPHFAVSDDEGSARLDGVPAGTHSVEVWHPALGTTTREVEVREGETTQVVFDLTR
jgi:hypothetical protein